MSKQRSKGKNITKAKTKRHTARSGNQRYSHLVVIGWVIITAVVWLVIRYNYLEIPLDRDEGSYVYMGKAILEGQLPYIDFYEIKPPGIFYTYALFVFVFGTSVFGLHAGLLILLGATGYLVFWLSRLLIDDKLVPWIALSLFLLLSLNVRLSPFTICSEQFASFFTLGAVISLYYAFKNKHGRFLWLGGALMAWSVLIRQTGIFYYPVFIAIIVYKCFAGKRFNWKLLRMYLLPFFFGSLLPVVIMLLILIFQGSLDEAYYWLIQRPLQYATSVASETRSELFKHFLSMAGQHFEGVWILAGLGLIVYLASRHKVSDKILIAGMIGGAFLGVSSGGRYYGHYGINLFPYAAFCSAFGIHIIGKSLDGLLTKRNLLSISTTILFIGFLWLWPIYKYRTWTFAKIPGYLNIITYGSNPFNEIKYLCDYANTIKRPGDRLAVIGSEPQAYLYLDQLSPTRHIFPSFISKEDEINVQFQEEAAQSIEEVKPRFMLFVVHPYSWSFAKNQGPSRTFYNWGYRYAQNHYRRIGLAQIYEDRPSTYLFGPEATRANPNSPYHIELYERR